MGLMRVCLREYKLVTALSRWYSNDINTDINNDINTDK